MRSINSVLSQSFRDFELIVVDDGSADGSLAAINSCARTDDRIKVVSQSNKGQNSALKKGILVSRGKYLSFLDAGDVWVPNFLNNLLGSIRPIDGFIYCWVYGGPKSYLGIGSEFLDVVKQGFLSSMITLLVRRGDWIDELEAMLPDSYTICQDDKFCFELARRYSFSLYCECLAYSVPEPNSMTRNLIKVSRGWSQLYFDYKDYIASENCVSEQFSLQSFVIQSYLRSGSFINLLIFIFREGIMFRSVLRIKYFRLATIGFVYRFKYLLKAL